MPSDSLLIPDPVLDDRKEQDRIAARLHRSIGNLSTADADLIIAYGESLRDMIEDYGSVTEPLLPELSSVRPAEAHTTLLTEIERAFSETLYRFNQLPNKVRIALLRQLGVTLLPATSAATMLLFSKSEDYLDIPVTIPAGTEVVTDDYAYRVVTDVELVIGAGTHSASVAATSVDAGDIGRIPPYTIAVLTSAIAGIETVVNNTPLTGGTNAESTLFGEIRAREEFAIGEHLGSVTDWENWIYYEILRRQGRVTAFEGYLSDFSQSSLGYLLLIIQGSDGLAPTDAILNAIGTLISDRHVAGISVAARAPEFKEFDIAVTVTIKAGGSPSVLTTRATKNLETFFDPMRFAFGPTATDREIGLSDIVGQIESAGPNIISVATEGNNFAIVLTIDGVDYQEDVPLEIGELPSLGTVTYSYTT